jgi:hypothetical protein
MDPSLKADLAARDGDSRLYLLLGIAAWFLFLDHVPHNAVSLLTMRNFGFSGAADLFVFVCGYSAAVLYGRMMLERGFIVTATRIFKRLWQLYASYIVLFVIYINLIGYVARKARASEIIGDFNAIGIVDHTVRTLIHGLLLQAKPLNLEVLQLLIVLTAAFPFVLVGMMRRPHLTMAASIGLYAAAYVFGWNLSSFPEGKWSLNPFCWQLLFVLGAWLALCSGRQIRTLQTLQQSASVRTIAGLYLLFALVITAAAKFPQAGFVPDGLRHLLPFDQRENLAPFRVLHFLALAYMFAYLVPQDWRGFGSPALQPVIRCGQEWLAVFCAGVFLSFAGHLVLITGPDSIVRQILVSVAGISIMTGVAYYVSWSKRQDQKPVSAGRTTTDPTKADARSDRVGRLSPQSGRNAAFRRAAL